MQGRIQQQVWKLSPWGGRSLPRTVRPRSLKRVACQGSHLPEQQLGVLDRRERFLKYVQEVQPQMLEEFKAKAPSEVVEAMRQTVGNLLGTLPLPLFQVVVTPTRHDSMENLMYSVMMTGYMFQNVQYRLELKQRLASLPPPDAQPLEDRPQYAKGTQKRVQGEVLRWNTELGTEIVPAADYIESLEAELASVREQLSKQLYIKASGNTIINYIRTMEHDSVRELTNAGNEVVESIHVFISRMLGATSAEDPRVALGGLTTNELSRMLFWLMVVGYSLRALEVRCDLEEIQ